MRTRRFWLWVITAIAVVTLSVVLRNRQPAAASTSPHSSSLSRSPAAPNVALPVDEHLLEEKRIERIAAKVIDGLAAKSGELSPQVRATSAANARTAAALKRELANYRKEVQALSKYLKDLAIYTSEIEHSLHR